MKKIVIAILLLLSVYLTGCFKNPVEPNEGSITLTLPDDYKAVLSVSEVPEFTFTFEGNLNTVLYSDTYTKVFSHNEDKILSDAINKFLKENKDRVIIDRHRAEKVSSVHFSTLNEFGKVVNEKYTPDNKMAYAETAYVSLPNGLRLSMDYLRFIYNGEDYYTWRPQLSVTFYLYYPMMVVDTDELTNKIVLIALPNGVGFKIGPNLRVNALLNDSTYVDNEKSVYYTFEYCNIPPVPADDKEFDRDEKDNNKSDKELTEEEKQALIRKNQQTVIDYYVKNFDGVYNLENKTITYSYLGHKFKVELYDKNFKMHYVGEDVNTEK